MASTNNLLVAKPSTPWALAPQDAELFEAIIEAWARRRLSSLRHTEKAVARDVAIVRDFASHSQLPPWLWTEDSFDAWCDHLGLERALARSSQRHYQSSIRTFLDYLTTNVKFRNDIRRLYGIDPRQICSEENCIPHTTEREGGRERRAFTHNEIDRFFEGLRMAAVEAGRFHAKDYNPLRRDRMFFFTLYSAGLRISEALKLDLTSFQPNPNIPAFGDFGFINVWGKGSKGSGPRFRSVPVTHTDFPALLDWYINKVRPEFLTHADPNEQALFLSERGHRLKISAAEYRFHVATRYCNLEGQGLSPHCLRHTSVTHESMRFSMEAVRRKHGHSTVAVTQVYMHVPDEIVNEEISNVVAREIDNALDDKEQTK